MKPVNPGLKVTLVGAASNILLSVIKFIGGILGNSTAMMADAVHSLSDPYVPPYWREPAE